jgi:Flp pilus assembly protein TadD
MSVETSPQIINLSVRRRFVAVGVIVGVIIILAFGWFAIRWQIGNLLATAFNDLTDENVKQIAQDAYLLAPSDPRTSLFLARTEDSEKSLENYKQAVRLSPSDYRLWIEFARLSGQKGETDKAEQAFRQAIKLAPEYSSSHWYFGNFLLRQNRTAEAFVELRKSAENNAIYHPQVFSLVWTFFGEDTRELEKTAGNSPELRTGLAKFYAIKGRGKDSLTIWNSLSEQDKKANAAYGRQMAQILFEKQLFHSALELVRQLDIESGAAAGMIQNGGFEKPIEEPKDVYFGWRISSVEKLNIKLDPTQKYEGNRSLRVTFNGYSQPLLFNITQIVSIEPRSRYRLTFWMRTENLKSGGTPNLEVYNVIDNKILATSAAFPSGSNDWKQVTVDFSTPENTEGIAIRTTRVYCGENCPIFGTLWYDDFRLEKIK